MQDKGNTDQAMKTDTNTKGKKNKIGSNKTKSTKELQNKILVEDNIFIRTQNVRDKIKQGALKNIKDDYRKRKFDIMALQETKLKEN